MLDAIHLYKILRSFLSQEIIDVQRLSDLFLKYAKLGDSDSIRDALRHATNEEIKALASAKDTDKVFNIFLTLLFRHYCLVDIFLFLANFCGKL